MLSYRLLSGLRAALVSGIITRNKGSGASKGPGSATDPVQQLFVDKIREYRQKSPDGAFVDPSPTIIKELEKEREKLDKNYGGGPGVDMTAFPTFKFEEPIVDPIDEAGPEDKKKTKKKKTKKKRKSDKSAKKAVRKSSKKPDEKSPKITFPEKKKK